MFQSFKITRSQSGVKCASEAAIIQDAQQRKPKVSCGGILLGAHRKYQLRVQLLDDQIGQVSLIPDEHLRPLGPPQEYMLGAGRKEYILHFETTRVWRPYLVRARASILMNHVRWGSYCHELPVVIWPSVPITILWSLVTIGTTVWFPYLAQAFILEGHLRPVPEILDKLRDSQELLLITAVGTIGVGLLVYLANWGYQLFVTSVDC